MQNQKVLNTHSLRRDDLDWLRVIAFGILIFFHVGMFFSHWGWHIKNNVMTHDVEWPMRFTSQWRMALLFMISGAGVYFALNSRTPGSFLKERFVRIFIPLVFGMFVVVPPQIFFERLTQGETYVYTEFYKTVFQFQFYPEGSFSWHHLWYLVYIFVYSIIILPLLLLIRRRPGMTAKWSRFFSNPVTLIVIPVIWHLSVELLLGKRFPTTHDLIRDWHNHFHSISLFVSGFVLCTQISFWETLARYRRLTTGIWLALTIILYTVYWTRSVERSGLEELLYLAISTTNAWCVLLSAFGNGYRFLRFSNRFLKYANEAVYPFYILHQTVIVCLAYPLINAQWPWGVKYIYLSIATIIVCFALYHFLIRRVGILRLFFGLKIKSHRKATAEIAIENTVS